MSNEHTPSPDEIRAHLSGLTPTQQAEWVAKGLNKNLAHFEALGIRPDAITNALQVALVERAQAAHDKVSMGQWLTGVGGWLLAIQAEDLPAQKVPTHHIYVELITYAVGRYLAEGYSREDLRDVFVAMITDLGPGRQT